MFKLSLYIFSGNLRLQDNEGLIETMKLSKQVIPCYVFDKDNPLLSNYHYLNFLIESLIDLNANIKKINKNMKLYCFRDYTINVVRDFINLKKVDHVAMDIGRSFTENNNFTEILNLCVAEKKIKLYEYTDFLLFPFNKIKMRNKMPYTNFGSYYKQAAKIPIKKPVRFKCNNFFTGYPKIESYLSINKVKQMYIKGIKNSIIGGRISGLKELHKIKKNTKTNLVSPWITHGCLSVKEYYHHLKKVNNTFLLRNLFLREFYFMTSNFDARLFFYKPINNKIINYLDDTKSKKIFKSIGNANSGFPIIDCLIKKLINTGYLTEYEKDVLAVFFTKYLHLDPKYGLNLLMTYLIDTELVWIISNWLRISGEYHNNMNIKNDNYLGGIERISRKIDPKCLVIKKWVPGLNSIPDSDIHKWEIMYAKHNKKYKPIINSVKSTKDFLKLVKINNKLVIKKINKK